MGINIVTGFTHNGREYSVPTSTDQRKRFVREVINTFEALDGVTAATNAGTTSSWDSVRLEVELQTEGQRLIPNPRSLSPRLRSALDACTPVSHYDVVHTPTPVNADDDIYRHPFYIIEIYLY